MAFDFYPPHFGPTSQWHTFTGQCVLVAAGGAVLDVTGELLRYGLQRPMLNPEFVAVGDKAIAPVINWAK